MTETARNVREALLAELVGDVHLMLDRVEGLGGTLSAIDGRCHETARALDAANTAYREQLDDLMARLRVEFATVVTGTTEQAARAMVGQQTVVLQRSATAALRNALTHENVKRAKADWLRLVAAGAVVGGLVATAVMFIGARVF